MPIRDVMTPNPVAVGPSASVAEAAALMVRRRIRHLPVVDPDGLLVGLISERDVRRAMGDPASVQVSAVMVRQPHTIGSDASLRDATTVLVEKKFGALPVVDGDQLVGIITPIDVMRAWLKS